MASISQIPWWRWLPLPWQRWSVILTVEAADEIPVQLPKRGVVLVGTKDAPKWIAFDCPCTAGHRVMLNLDRSRRPQWVVKEWYPLSLSPSIDQITEGKRCHYFVNAGRIRWVPNT